MNINMHSYVDRSSLNAAPLGNGETLAETIARHAEVMLQAGFPLEEVPVDHAILETVGPDFQGAMRIWLLLQGGGYVWIDERGEAQFREWTDG